MWGIAGLLEFDFVFDCLTLGVRGLAEAAGLFEAVDLVHFLGGDEEWVVAGGYGNFDEVLGFEAAENFGDLPTAEALAPVVRQDAVMANYGRLGAWSGVVGGHAYGLAVQAGDEGAGSDGVGIFKDFAVEFAHLFFKLIVPNWGVALGK